MYSLRVIAKFWKIKKLYVISVFFGKLKDIPRPLLSALYTKYLIDCLIKRENFLNVVYLLLLFFLLDISLSYYDTYSDIKYRSKVREEISGMLMSEFLEKNSKISLKYFEDAEFCNKNSLATNELVRTHFNLFNYCVDLLVSILSMFALAVFVFSLDRVMILFAVIVLLLYFVFSSRINKLRMLQEQEMIPIERYRRYFAGMLSNYDSNKNIRIYNAENFFVEKWKESTSKLVKIVTEFSVKFLVFFNLNNSLFFLFQYSITLYTAYIVWIGKISVGSFSALTQSIFSFMNQLRRCSEIVVNMNESANHFKIIEEIDSYVPDDNLAKSNLILDKNKSHSIEFKNLTFSYVNSKKKSLDNVSFKIQPNEKVAIVGDNGSGKSTIINLLLRLYEPPENSIFIDGIDIKEYDLRTLRNNFSVVMQNQENYSLTVLENILLKNDENFDKERVENVLKLSKLHSKIMSYKNGISSMVTKRFKDYGLVLSGGESQKLNISRFLNKDATILILDEYEKWLDKKSKKEIFENILAASKNKILIMISHDNQILSAMDKVYTLEDGKLKFN